MRHIPRVLYHWRRHTGSTSGNLGVKPYAREASLRARKDHAERREFQSYLKPGRNLYIPGCVFFLPRRFRL